MCRPCQPGRSKPSWHCSPEFLPGQLQNWQRLTTGRQAALRQERHQRPLAEAMVGRQPRPCAMQHELPQAQGLRT